MSKREARIARADEKALKEQEKSARLRDRPSDERQVRQGANPDSVYQMRVTWSCNKPDCKDHWSWGPRQWSDEEWETQIKQKLDAFSGLTWGEIDSLSSGTGHKMHHSMSTEDICDEAQYRLVEIEMDQDPIFRFRLGNKPRLWGFRTVAHFEVLWFDPKHMIYPTDLS